MLTVLALWVMGCVYNIPPVRSKDLPYVDVLSEAINNPIRMLAGWFIVTDSTIAPSSLLLSYWMIGCYFMALKRYAEFRNINDPRARRRIESRSPISRANACSSRSCSTARRRCCFFGAFCMRYRLELILAFPAIALVMALYLSVAMKDNSAAQNPERLYREPALMAAVVGGVAGDHCSARVDLPVMQRIFTPTAPTSRAERARCSSRDSEMSWPAVRAGRVMVSK